MGLDGFGGLAESLGPKTARRRTRSRLGPPTRHQTCAVICDVILRTRPMCIFGLVGYMVLLIFVHLYKGIF